MKNSFNHKIKQTIAFIFLFLPLNNLLAAEINDKVMLFSILELIKKEYVQDVGDKALVEAAVDGMLRSLDPHSGFLNEKEFEEMRTANKGEFGGIGVEITIDQGGLRIISPIDDTPAFRAKIKPGDLIFAIDEELISNMTPYDAVNKMRGTKGTKVKISILRNGEAEPIELTLTREIIKASPVKSHLYKDIGYIRVASFSNQTSDAVAKSIKDLKAKSVNNKLKGYILDLRNNPGGLLEQAISTTDLFLDQGVIVSTKGRDEKEHMVFKAEPGSLLDNIPIVVLINNGSASASEIVAGALQDNKRAIILGVKSFGKGSVQKVIPIPGYGAIRLTTALYYTPSGKSIQAEGIVPDIMVEPAKIESLEVKDKKLVFSEAKLKNHLLNKQNETKISNKFKESLNKDSKEEVWVKLYEQDYQLARAIDVLESMQVLQNWR